jgi:RNA polymerase sigma-70 factor (ECF subfamily)
MNTTTLMTSAGSSILERIAAGDESAITELFDRYSRLVWWLARRSAVNASDAEDAVQDVFVLLWKYAGQFDPSRGSESTYISVLARRCLIARRRKEAVMNRLVQQYAAAHTTSPLGEVRPECESLDHMVSQLRTDQQCALRLALAEGLSARAIANRLEMPVNTVKTAMRRGLMQLRRQAQASLSVE